MGLIRKMLRLLKRIAQELKFIAFVMKIDPRTWRTHGKMLEWARHQADTPIGGEIVARGNELRARVLREFKDKYKSVPGLRLMIHIPPKHVAPGGFSLFSNLADSLEYIGVPVKKLYWADNFNEVFSSFSPTHLMTSDHLLYLDRIDWDQVAGYKKSHPLAVGLTASVDLQGDRTLADRLEWGAEHKIDFYFGFRTGEYYRERKEYTPYFERGHKIVSIEFGANPLFYYPVHTPVRDLDYIFLASSNVDKHEQYFKWLPGIVFHNAGFIDGPGWHRISHYAPREVHRFLYARAKIGLNLHIADSLRWASELNERTYILAACGIPQLIDNPKLLFERFSREAVFSASTPEEYARLYRRILADPAEGERRALLALEEVYARHTTFHRAETLVRSFQSSPV